jgi:hypothetical protein
MKNLILPTLLFFISYSGYSQAQAQATQVKVQSTTINQREYADRMPSVLDEIKPNSMNLDKIKGFVLVKVSHSSGRRAVKSHIKVFKELFANTPFKLIDGTKKPQPYIEGYIYITQSSIILNNNNFNSSWVFRNHKKRTVYGFNTTNIGLTETLAKIGITTY